MKLIKSTIVIGSFLLLNGCGPSNVPEKEGGYYHNNIYFGKDLSPSYKKGIKDGCTTSNGRYKKSHYLFNNDIKYSDGWFIGRNKCRHLLVLESD
ncbi:MAG: hypothetical protein U9O24_03830 [Campylobacterota bacterium]|nr:hypothetical protein [Campylobacterota bacterium]